jgi:hypothetical protein
VNAPDGIMFRFSLSTRVFGGYLRNDHITCDGYGVNVIFGGDAGAQTQIGTSGAGPATGQLRVRNGAHCNLMKVNVIGDGTIGIAVETGGTLDITGLAAQVQIEGGQYAIWCRYGAGQARLHEANPAITQITPGGHKYAVGAAPTASDSILNVGDTLVPVANDDGSRITRVE